MKCQSCTVEIAEDSLSCPSCGAEIEGPYAQTRILPEASKPYSPGNPSSGRKTSTPSRLASIHSTSSDSLDRARFIAGTIIGERYRIIGLLGRGGMGEVYRAEDLTLDQPVALKFLPETFYADDAALARLLREVRVARQITHRNVCRVYDIGEHEGAHFLSMEFIRGEELSSVLKRFGRLPSDKATEIARQVCAGLAAAHDAGVLHRDLKPANVMIDENGNVRITDFGLAGLTEEFVEGVALEGTPEYMSPEQLAGRELTVKSDIYALGLVLYELYTGKKAFTAKTLNELLRLRRSELMPESLSSIVKDVDPAVERVIERCLTIEPKDRPATALQVAAALPGGDPLAAALAAGETPSPEMVAAAPKQGSLRPAVAIALLSAALVAFALCFALSDKVYLQGAVPMEKSAQGLRERAGEIARKFGYDRVVDDSYGFNPNEEYIKYVVDNDRSPTRWSRMKTGHPAGLVFWYRQSPRYIEPFNREAVTPFDPPQNVAGMAGMSLDTRGRMLNFYGVPPQVIDTPQSEATKAPFDWSKLFNEAGLDISTFKQVEPKWVPTHPSDTQAAWEGFYPEQPDSPLRIEAAAFRGKPVFFMLVNPWTKAARQELPTASTGQTIGQVVVISIFFIIIIGAALLARLNLKLGRANRKGAFHLAAFLFVLTMVTWLLGTHHVPRLTGEFNTFIAALAFSVMVGGLLWLVYVALEPFLRRRWPTRTIAWNRLLAGDWRDPLVGRDLLIGATFGCCLVLLGYLSSLLPQWLGLPAPTPTFIYMGGLRGFQYIILCFVEQTLNSLIFPSVLMFLLLLASMITRREWIAVVLFWVFMTTLSGGETPLIDYPLGAITTALVLFVLLRFGMLATLFMQFFILFFNFYPITADLNAWYAGATIFAAALGVGLIFFGFRTSLAGQRLFSGSFVGD
jgi:serine/threonine protein kinase